MSRGSHHARGTRLTGENKETTTDQAVHTMIAVQKIQPFRVVPWEPLRFREPQGSHQVIAQGDGARVEVDRFPSFVCERFVGTVVATKVHKLCRGIPG